MNFSRNVKRFPKKSRNPHSNRGLICKNDAFSPPDHKHWDNWETPDGLLHIGYKHRPFVTVRGGFEYFVHGYRATTKLLMTDTECAFLMLKLKNRYGGTFVLQPNGILSGVFWKEYFVNEYGCRIYRNRFTECVNDIPEFHIMIEVDGSYCEMQSVDESCYDIIWLTTEVGFKMTRVDCKVRDCESRVTIDQLEFWRDHGHIRGVRKFERTRGELLLHHNMGMISLDRTVTFGKRSGNKYLRCYEPGLLHHTSGLDWECEYKAERAVTFATKIAQVVSDSYDDADIPFQLITQYIARGFLRVIADSVFSAINIIKLNGKERDYDRLPEYQALIDAVFSDIENTPIMFYTPKKLKPIRQPLPTIDTKMAWLFKQVAPTLYAVASSFDEDNKMNFLRVLISNGEDRISRYQRAIAKQGLDTPPDISGEIRRLEIMEMLPAV